MTVLKTKRFTAVQGVLLGGLTFLALMYLPGMFYTKSMVKDQYWWWWVVHLWVEGSWELIAAALLAFMLHKLLNADVKMLAKWMYIEVRSAWSCLPGYSGLDIITTGSAPLGTGCGSAASLARLNRFRSY
jgi:nitric oxide reductase large subunit